MKNHEEG